MKPSIAVAALEEGVINTSSTVTCSGYYHYRDITLKCTGVHGALNVVSAINHSCNSFFYEMGRRLGINTMNTYRKCFGLGQKTGIEIEEASGTLDSPAYRQSLNQTWYPGFNLQSAIGNAGDVVTPIQLANYCATVANGGNLYKCTLIKSVKSYDCTKTISENKPVLLRKSTFSKTTMDAVRQGMHLVGTVGFCADTFSSLSVEAAAKTGTSQVEKTVNGVTKITNNGFLITFAPYGNPEIAICVALEGAPSGSSVAPVARDIYNYYFSSKEPDTSTNKADQTNSETTTVIQNYESILLP
ncbi:Peptidoglycan D,D-transpeptidase MrdA [bioreactor metagenome]|uniref:Peptidoglycan D,D-transpeptidase MrdA n=1 Tax=bioreactor metagenome TaxID=1076179 RepID=A0A645BNC0_9ZZZZ